MKATINGVTLHYEVHGRGQPVLFVHGFPLSSALWEPLIEPMQDDYRLIIPDLRGFGESEASETASMAQYADDLAALLDHIGERRPVVIVGLSMGGYVVFEFFRRHRERVHALVLVDTRAQADDEAGRKSRFETIETVRAQGSGVVADSMVGKLFSPAASDDLRDHWHEIMSAVPPEGIIAALQAMADRPDSRSTLGEINRPTLVVVGGDDAITPLDDARAMHEAIAGSELETVADAGHLTPVEQPQRFVAVLQQFLDDLDPVDQQGWPKRPDIPE